MTVRSIPPGSFRTPHKARRTIWYGLSEARCGWMGPERCGQPISQPIRLPGRLSRRSPNHELPKPPEDDAADRRGAASAWNVPARGWAGTRSRESGGREGSKAHEVELLDLVQRASSDEVADPGALVDPYSSEDRGLAAVDPICRVLSSASGSRRAGAARVGPKSARVHGGFSRRADGAAARPAVLIILRVRRFLPEPQCPAVAFRRAGGGFSSSLAAQRPADGDAHRVRAGAGRAGRGPLAGTLGSRPPLNSARLVISLPARW